MTRIMRIEHTARKYFHLLLKPQSRREEEKAKLVALSCFTIIIPAFFAIVCAISALRGRVRSQSPALQHPLRAWFPHLKIHSKHERELAANAFQLLQIHSEETRELLKEELQPFSYLQQPRHIAPLIFHLELITSHLLSVDLCLAFGPLFKKWNPDYLLPVMNQLTGELAVHPHKREQLPLIAGCLETLYPPPLDDREAIDNLSTVLAFDLTPALVDLMKAAFPKPPSRESATLYLTKMFAKAH